MTFLIISLVVFNLMAILIPKQLSKIEIYASIMFGVVFELVVNIILGLTLKMYSYFEKGVQPYDFLVIFGIFPAFNVIVLNYFPFKKSVRTKSFYIVGWSAFLVLYEWASVKLGFFNHYTWKLWYSALCYPVILTILAWNLTLVKKLVKSSHQ
jgi:hypothetical protein